MLRLRQSDKGGGGGGGRGRRGGREREGGGRGDRGGAEKIKRRKRKRKIRICYPKLAKPFFFAICDDLHEQSPAIFLYSHACPPAHLKRGRLSRSGCRVDLPDENHFNRKDQTVSRTPDNNSLESPSIATLFGSAPSALSNSRRWRGG